MSITGKDLLDAGYKGTGSDFGKALAYLNKYSFTDQAMASWIKDNQPKPLLQLQTAPDLIVNLDADTDQEKLNKENVIKTMEVLMQTPNVVNGVVMPDAMPAGPEGTIPVGGVVVTKGTIHPGMHSADVCCSMMVTEFKDADPAKVMDAISSVTHFGRGGRQDGHRFTLSHNLYADMMENLYTSSNRTMDMAVSQLGTQGDGNHFSYVGINNAGSVCLVTHHGSRGVGAQVYKKGLEDAQYHTNKVVEGVLPQNAWLDYDSGLGYTYWDALQLVRRWTKANHAVLHTAVAEMIGSKIKERFWNEHNFVFMEDDLFYHAKGATPIHNDFMPDSSGKQIVPLNMAQPVLIVEGTANSRNLGFAPHGAGRNMSRTAHSNSLDPSLTHEEIFAKETKGLDIRTYCPDIDMSELPSAYKDGPKVRQQMEDMGLAKVVDEIQPYGSIMAGDLDKNAPWRIKREAKRLEKQLIVNNSKEEGHG